MLGQSLRLQLQNILIKVGHYHQIITLETLFNIAEAPCNFFWNFVVCVVWWCSDGPINGQEYKSFEMYAVTIEISMTEYHHWINGQDHHLLWGEMRKINPVTCLFSLFEAPNGAVVVQILQGFICLTHWALYRPHQNVVWYNNSWLGFLKILNYVPTEREKKSAKKWALICYS